MIRALQTRGIFLCHCDRTADDTLWVGLMMLNPPYATTATLFDRDNEDETLTVELPQHDQPIAETRVELKIHADPIQSQA